MARKTYHGDFRKNGRSFRAENTFKQDRKGPEDKYYLTMAVVSGWYKIVHDPHGNVPKFGTIREAQEYAWACGDFIDEYVY